MHKLNRFSLSCCAAGVLLAVTTSAHAVSVPINNPGFESGWDDWTDTDPSAISGESYSGNSSAKITGSAGRVEQTVSVDANTDYRLSVYVKGSGKIGAMVSGTEHSTTGGGSSFEEVAVEFNSGSATSVTLFAAYDGAEGRVDDFFLETTDGGVDPDPPVGNVDCTGVSDLAISSASDDGTNDGHVPANTIDGDLADSSRWSSDGNGKWISYDLGQLSKVNEIQALWYKGDSRSAYFDIDTSADNTNWTSVLVNGQSSGSSSSYETHALLESEARYVRITGYGNSSNTWNSIIETKIGGCTEGSTDPEPPAPGSLDPNLPPSGNFDLLDWSLGVPVDNNNDGKSDTIKDIELSGGYEHSDWFYTGSDGGMVFKAPIDAPKTSTNTSYTRSELREMLRRGDTSISTQGINDNNWVFSSYSSSDKSAAGGIDGELNATLKVDHVTTTGDTSQRGRVIIGQIHAKNDEPARLYYRLLPGHSKGSVYLAHEPGNGNSEQWYNMIGDRSSSASEPADGIALGEIFSYSIKVVANQLTVTIYRDGKADVVQSVDMSNSGYHDGTDQYMYFKAGVYNQNNTGDGNDYVQATFYSLSKTHDGYSY
ncbi:polysaccharide lyase family 7 protein [Bowmanella dokdonensis]|uniref:Polysaccharide lyase family 7 protein n=1 Tax=Bowmanella dokdonensis TaxID=751969 RepID=A0A939DQJ9_9ALTE|nr:polysaccharide lyase family 7 protein [Bowmanella dokdonensis]MBN7827149.1 polysaccharide lyase family 7 protein [Bowmanella dokdonensis]